MEYKITEHVVRFRKGDMQGKIKRGGFNEEK
jgi:hypothetical protein